MNNMRGTLPVAWGLRNAAGHVGRGRSVFLLERRFLMARRFGVITLALLCAMLIVASAMAQPPGGGGGPGGFGPGMMGGMGANLMRLLRNQDVQNDLQLTTDQKDKLRDAAQSMGMGNMRDRMQELRDLAPEERQTKMQELMKEMQEKTEKQLAEILQPAQLDRLKEIRLQVMGGAALALPEVAKALNITDEQTEKLKAIQQQVQDKMREAVQDLSQEERMAKMREIGPQMRTEALAKVLEVLTPQQKEAFEKLKGKKIDIDLSTLMGPRPGG
jgi:Spy/CpxP family protein refolding chaperone